jgi:hypothetical protein
VVLGNPPWERIRIQEKEWFASHRPDIANAANAAQRRKIIAALVHEDAPLYMVFHEELRKAEGESHLIRHSERYPLSGRGDVNTYSIFAENMRILLASAGKVGCIVPSGIATDDTTKFFFQNLMETRSLASLYDFENREGIFPAVHRSYKFCLLTLTGSSRPATKGAEFLFFAQNVNDLQGNQRRFVLSSKDIKLLNPNTKTCSIFRSKHDADLNKTIYHRMPVFINDQTKSNSWGAYYMRLVDLGDHAEHLRFSWEEKGPDWNIPLYESKLIGAFDHRLGTFADTSHASCVAGQPRALSNAEKANAYLGIDARYFLPRKFAQEIFAKYQDYKRSWLLIWRDIARSTDERTCFATAIPKVLASRTCPALGFSITSTPVGLLANLNTFIFDYLARQKVGGTHLNFSVLKQLPVLVPQRYQSTCTWDSNVMISGWSLLRVLELTYTAWDLEPFAKDCGYDGPPFRWNDERRFLLRCELDAAYFHLYGIERDDVDYIMDTFRVWKEKEEKQYGEYRTKRVILEIYDEMQQAIESGVPYQARLDPPPADPAMAHAAREEGSREG